MILKFLFEQDHIRRFKLFLLLRLSMNRFLESKHIRPWIIRKAGIKLGNHAHIGANVTFDNWSANLYDIGEYCTITMNTILLTHGMVRQEDNSYRSTVGKLIIGKHVFIGAGTIITRPVTIRDNVMIGAGSIVTKDIPSNCVVAGNPAKIIRSWGGQKFEMCLAA